MSKFKREHICKIRKDFLSMIEYIDDMKINDESKFYHIEKFFDGYKAGLETIIGGSLDIADIREVDIMSEVCNAIKNLDEQLSKVDPGIEIIGIATSYHWGEIVKGKNRLKKRME